MQYYKIFLIYLKTVRVNTHLCQYSSDVFNWISNYLSEYAIDPLPKFRDAQMRPVLVGIKHETSLLNKHQKVPQLL